MARSKASGISMNSFCESWRLGPLAHHNRKKFP